MPVAVDIIDLRKKFDLPVKPAGGLFQFLPSHLFPGHLYEDFWALRGVSFKVEKGRLMGIIGRNGSGKSTLLKIIAGILEPTSGAVQVSGRVAALLELGAGFHEELTGMENIFLNGAILGLTHKEIIHRLPSIIEFSGLEEFIDTPVKHYSSGMQARLGFSIATNMNPEILLIDEVMSVGDLSFQSKCISRITDFRKQGKTILLVTHEIDVANLLCDDLMWLEDGQVRMIGPAAHVAHEYRVALHGGNGKESAPEKDSSFTPPCGGPIIQGVRFLDAQEVSRPDFRAEEPMSIEITYDTGDAVLTRPGIRVVIIRSDNVVITDLHAEESGFTPASLDGRGKLFAHFRPLLLLKNRYDVSVYLFNRDQPDVVYDQRLRQDCFESVTKGVHNPFMVTHHPCFWTIEVEQE